MMTRAQMRVMARSNLLAFIKDTKPEYGIGWVHRDVCARLMRFLVDVERRKSPRLILTMPPRHGKSEIVSKRFPAWSFGVDPDASVIVASYSDSLAKRINKDVQRIMDADAYSRIFPDTSLSVRRNAGGHSTAIRTMELFEIPGYSGSFRTTGVGGGITGMGCDILIIDDPFKDRKTANSPTVRQSIWDWYASTAYTRLSPGGGVVVMHTRWHEDDLVGRLLEAQKNGGDAWELVNYPAIAEEDERYRKKGEALDPSRYPIASLNAIRKAIGEEEFAALYQQHPTPATGGIFRKKWFQFYDSPPTVFDRMLQSWDFTFKDTAESDNVCGTVWGQVGARFYLLDLIAERMDFVSQVRAMRRMCDRWPQAVAKLVEDKANGSAIISALGREIPGILPVNPLGSKTSRAYAVSPLFEAGNVWIPKHADWTGEYVRELAEFPNAKHDDRVDSTTQMLNFAVNRGASGIASYF